MNLTSIVPSVPRPATFSAMQLEEGVLYVAESTVEFGGFYAIRSEDTLIYLDCRGRSNIWTHPVGSMNQTSFIKASPGTQIVISVGKNEA